MRTAYLFAATATLLPALAAQENEPPKFEPLAADRQKGFESIDVETCTAWLTYLASDELGGRETGQPGYKLAADFIAARFKEFGLKPVGGDGTYFQAVPFAKVGPNVETSYLAIRTAEGEELFRVTPGKGLGGQISEKSDREAEIVELVANTVDDVKDADVKGKVVLFTDKSSRGRRSRATFELWRAAPAGIISVNDEAAATVRRRIAAGGSRNSARRGRFRRPNTYSITGELALQIRAALKEHGTLTMKAFIEIERKPVFAANVVGFLEGSDPALKHEIVGVGSHLDHIGKNGQRINNGADDDGSGTTGVLAVARAFSVNGVRPRRSILFMCFSGEEKGLIGSRHYVNNPIFPNENMIAELQMDMIGRNEEFVNRRSGEVTEKAEDNVNSLHLVGTKKLSMDLHEVCLEKNSAHIGFDFEYDEEDVFGRSDHANFARKDIPIAFFFTGFHPQYHQPDDTVDRINFPKLVRVAKLVYSVAFEIADRDERIVRDRLFKDVPRTRRRR